LLTRRIALGAFGMVVAGALLGGCGGTTDGAALIAAPPDNCVLRRSTHRRIPLTAVSSLQAFIA
jgi:hypothetical protein